MVSPDNASRMEASQSVTLNGSGNGTARFAPAGESWQIQQTSVKTNQTLASISLDAQARIYRRQIGDSFVVDNGTYSGSSGDTSNTTIELTDGEALFIVWTGGDPGAIATATIQGVKTTPTGGFRAVVR